jgi:uncharacterized protein (TIGR03437 family)
MRLQFRLNLRRLVLALIALLSFGAILLNQSDGYLRVSAAVQTVVSVNAASYEPGPLARGSLASVFGNNLAPQTMKSQDVPAPLKLSNVSVQLTDSAKVTHDAGLVMVSAKQINYVIPEAAELGAAQIVVKNDGKPVAQGKLDISISSPALFTSGSAERKLAAGMTSASGVDPQSITTTDGAPRMIGPGSPWAPTTVTLLGTGIRFASSVQINIGGLLVDPTFVGPADNASGVDQVSFRVPTNMRGGMNKISLVVNTGSSAAAPSGATTFAVGAAQSSATTQAAGAAESSSTTVTSNAVQALVQGDAPAGPNVLGTDDVKLILAQAVARAQQLNVAATMTVVDQEGNILGIFKMNGATSSVRLGSTDLTTGRPTAQLLGGMVDPDGLEQQLLPLAPGLGILSDGAALASISKAGTPAFFATQGSAISTRTASSIIDKFFPVGISDQAAGPLFGVQISSLPCSDTRNPLVNGLPNLPLGLAGDPGGLPLYKNGFAVGGLGVEADGLYSVDVNIQDNRGPNAEQSLEEIIAAAGTRGYRPSPAFQADRILIDGMRLEFSNVSPLAADGPTPAPFDSLVGTAGTLLAPIRGQQISGFIPLTLGGIPGRVIPDPSPGVNLAGGVRRGFFPFVGSTVSNLTASDVTTILIQGAQQAYRMRAAIRFPVPAPTEVNICVVDTSGAVLGQFSTIDAPQFGQPVSIQKARTALFFSLANAASQLQAANANVAGIVPGLDIGKYAAQSAAFGVPLNGQFAFSSRAMGFLARPFFPDGITIKNTVNGPFSKPVAFWSPFNTGLQVALVKPALVRILTGGTPPSGVPFNCSPLQNDLIFASGIQIFAGSSALYKNGVLVGAIGVSGDGIDQDDMVAFAGAFGFEPPAAIRADQLMPQGIRLPYVKFPRHPNIGNPPPVAPIIRTARVFPNTN